MYDQKPVWLRSLHKHCQYTNSVSVLKWYVFTSNVTRQNVWNKHLYPVWHYLELPECSFAKSRKGQVRAANISFLERVLSKLKCQHYAMSPSGTNGYSKLNYNKLNYNLLWKWWSLHFEWGRILGLLFKCWARRPFHSKTNTYTHSSNCAAISLDISGPKVKSVHDLDMMMFISLVSYFPAVKANTNNRLCVCPGQLQRLDYLASCSNAEPSLILLCHT